MSDIENAKYQVYAENRPEEVLHKGTIWECEHWVSKNGIIDTAYIIDLESNKRPKTANTSKKTNEKPTDEPMHSQSIKQISNKVDLLF